MLFKNFLKHLMLIAVVGQALHCSATGQISSRERFKLLPYLIPEDPGSLVLQILPKVNRYELDEVNSIYASKRDNPLVVNQSWQDLAINFLLHGQYERTIECIDEAQMNFSQEDLIDFKVVRGYAHAKLKNWKASNKEWKSLAALLPDSYAPSLHLFGNAVKQYKLDESSRILDKILAEHTELDLLLNHYIGIRHFQEGDLHQARVAFIKAIQPVRSNPYSLLGMSLLSLTESESYDAVGWLQRALENATIPQQRRFVALKSYSKIENHPDFRRIRENIELSKYEPPNPALEEDLKFRYEEKFELALLLEGGLKLRMFEPKQDVWLMR